MNTKYFILIIDDASSAEFSDRYWKNKPDFSLNDYIKENNRYPKEIPDLKLETRIYDDPDFNALNDFIFGPVDKFCITEKVKNILLESNLPEHRFFNVDVFLPRKRKKVSENYYAFHYDFYHISDILDTIDYEKTEILITNKNNAITESVKNSIDIINLPLRNGQLIKQIEELSATKKLAEKNKTQIEILENNFLSFNKPEEIVFNNKFNFSLDLFEIPLFSDMTYISERLKNKLEENNVTGTIIRKIEEVKYLVPRANPKLIWE